MNHCPDPQIVQPFSEKVFADLKNHISEVRRLFDWPGIAYHDKDQPKEDRFNRWCWHNLPQLMFLHAQPEFIALASKLAGRSLKPSYSFLSMYGEDGICPPHVDRPQCQFTIDVLVNSDHKEKPWPIQVAGKPYVLKEGDGLFYSGTGQQHFRNSMRDDSDAKKVDLVFFHFAPVEWVGGLS